LDKYEKSTQEMLENADATLIRQRRHIVFRLNNGEQVVLSKTPSAQNASRKRFSQVRRAIRNSRETASTQEPEGVVEKQLSTVKQRFKVPNREMQERDTDFKLVYNGATSSNSVEFQKSKQSEFTSLDELLDFIGDSESFWQLDGYGRLKVVQSFC